MMIVISATDLIIVPNYNIGKKIIVPCTVGKYIEEIIFRHVAIQHGADKLRPYYLRHFQGPKGSGTC